MTQFFMPMIPPTVTAQMHKVTVKNGKPVFYDPPEVKEARSKLIACLLQHKPKQPYTTGVQLVVKWKMLSRLNILRPSAPLKMPSRLSKIPYPHTAD